MNAIIESETKFKIWKITKNVKKPMEIRQVVEKCFTCMLFICLLLVLHNKYCTWSYLFRAYMSICNQFDIFSKNCDNLQTIFMITLWTFKTKHKKYGKSLRKRKERNFQFRQKKLWPRNRYWDLILVSGSCVWPK